MKNDDESIDSSNLKFLRNIGLAAHIDAGKTTTTEHMLFYTGRVHKIGEVDEGSTTTDWMVQEKERGITIVSAVTYCNWKDCRINIIDTPGHVDFTAEVERSMRVLDGLIVVFDAVGGVQPQSETVWRQANKYSVPRIAYINKMDRVGASFFGAAEKIEERLGLKTLLLQIPIGNESSFSGMVDLITMKALIYNDDLGLEIEETEIPEDLRDEAEKYREALIDTVSEQSDEITEKYLSGEEISEDEIREAIRKGVISLSFVPVLCGSSLKNKGVQPLLDAVVYYLPSPLDVPPVKGIHPVTNKVIERHASSKEPFSALVYKIQSDPFGKLTYIRVYSGTISAGSTVYNVRTKKRERFNRIIRLHADHREDVDSASAGDLYAVVGLKNVSTGDSLCDDKNPILLERIVFPEPVISVSIEASTRAEQEKLSDALTKLGEEDPTFKVSTDEETGQILISGMGELHLEIIIDRIINEFKVDASVGKPQVSYRESMRKISEGEGIFEKQISGKTIFGHVKITLEPSDEPSKIIFENELKNEEIPKTFIPFVEQGVKDALETGVMIGYPVIGIKAKLIGGTFREMESTDLAFKVASSMAVREAMAKNETFLMEPIMKVDVETPEEYLGEVIADLNSRRGRVEKMESTQIGIQQVEASVPLANMFGYATELRSLTQGRAVFSSEFMKYGEVPSNIQSEIMTRVLGYTV